VRTVREFFGAMTAERIDRGIVVTLRGYTDAAARFAKAHGIELVHEIALISLVKSASPETDPELLRLLNDRRKFCPRCEREMVLRASKKGSNAGDQFWGCSAFPRCKFTFPATAPESVSSQMCNTSCRISPAGLSRTGVHDDRKV
jgi:restriction system protein